jgi:hypothetical protein
MDNDYTGLSEEEKAALLEMDNDVDELGEIVDSDGEDGSDGKPNDEQADDKKVETGSDVSDDLSGDVSGDVGSKPIYTAPALVDSAEVIAQIKSDRSAAISASTEAKEALRAQYESGELADDEAYKKGLSKIENDLADKIDELQARRTEIDRQRIKSELSAEMREQQLQNEWASSVARFIKATAKTEGIDYNDAKRPLLGNALDAEVKRLSGLSEAATMSFDQVLEAAHKAVVEQFGLKVTAQSKSQQSIAKTTVKIPPNIGSAPSASRGNEESKFDHIDSLQGVARERALAQMSEAERDEYLSV